MKYCVLFLIPLFIVNGIPANADNRQEINECIERVSDSIPDGYDYETQRPCPYSYTTHWFEIPESSYVKIALLDRHSMGESDLPASPEKVIKDTLYTYYDGIMGPGIFMLHPWRDTNIDTLSAGIYLISFEALPIRINLNNQAEADTSYYRVFKETFLAK
ncbi:MAG: hypothetical protein GF310_01660 [candidate division Zixibacteria bacterium]|nr:hypothetical protein [candidate division Zixibacteria bacterium]